MKTTKEKEHYIKEIYKLIEDNKKVSVSSLSTTLGVSKSSVSNMLKKLVKMGLVNTAPYQPIILTKKGRNLFCQIQRRRPRRRRSGGFEKFQKKFAGGRAGDLDFA